VNVAENVLDMLAWGFGLAFIVLGAANLARALRNERAGVSRTGLEVLLSAGCIGLGTFFVVGALLSR
jgi:hypothetical protein